MPRPAQKPSQLSNSYAERHNGVDDVVVVLLQRLDGLLAAHARLLHHQLDVLALQTRVVDLLAIVFLFLRRLGIGRFDSLVLLAVVMASVRVGGFGVGELLGGGSLGLRGEVFDFGFAEDAVVLVRCY